MNHALASVKLLSDNHTNNPSLYGLLTIRAIEASETFGGKIICMAVTEDEERNEGLQHLGRQQLTMLFIIMVLVTA